MNFSPIWFSCSFCKKTFQFKSTLIQHRKDEHWQQIQKRKKLLAEGRDSFEEEEDEGESSGGEFEIEQILNEPIEKLVESVQFNCNYPNNFNLKDETAVTFWMDSINLDIENENEANDDVVDFQNFENTESFGNFQLEDQVVEAMAPITNFESESPTPTPEPPSEFNCEVEQRQKPCQLDPNASIERERETSSVSKDISKFLKIKPKWWRTKNLSKTSNSKTKFGCWKCSKSFTWKKSLVAHQKNCLTPNESIDPNDTDTIIDPTSRFEGNGIKIEFISENSKSGSENGNSKNEIGIEPANDSKDEFEEYEKRVAINCQFCNSKFLRIEQLLEHLKNCKFILSLESQDQNWDNKIPTEKLPNEGLVTPTHSESVPEPRQRSRPTSTVNLKPISKSTLKDPYKFEEPTENSKFNCPICGKCFPRKGALNSHVKIHTRPHACHLCEKKFAKSCRLRIHLSMHDQIGKVFQCEDCSKVFKQAGSLMRHQLIHMDHQPDMGGPRVGMVSLGPVPGPGQVGPWPLAHGPERPRLTTLVPPAPNWNGLMGTDKYFQSSLRNLKCPICPWIVPDELQMNQHFRNVHEDIFFVQNLAFRHVFF